MLKATRVYLKYYHHNPLYFLVFMTVLIALITISVADIETCKIFDAIRNKNFLSITQI